MFGEMLGGKGYSGGQEWDCMKDLEEDRQAFGIKFEGWREAAQKVGGWFRRVEEAAEVFMRKWHKGEREETAERHRTVATATPTVPNRLTPGYGYHRNDVCPLLRTTKST